MAENENPGTTLYPDLNADADGEAASLPTEEEPLKPDPHEEMRQELMKTEEEINTLRQVLHAKENYASELRKKLGLNPLSQISQTFKAELNRVQSSTAYQTTTQKVSELNEKITHSDYYKKTSETLKSAGQSTASAISSLGSSMSQKLTEMNQSVQSSAASLKNSTAFKSFEEKVEGVSTSIMAKVSGTAVEKEETPETAQEASETPVTEQPHQTEQSATAPPL